MTLSVKIGGEDVISRPFDMEAMCIIDDARYGDKNGALNMCKDVIPYLFDGTKATEIELKKLPLEIQVQLCNQAWKIYLDVMSKASKNG